jgi:hypothetical protein
MLNYSNPFLTPFGGSRSQFMQPFPSIMQPPPQAAQTPAQPEQDQYDFAGWADRLDRIEKGIGSLTEEFNSFQTNRDNAAQQPMSSNTNPISNSLVSGLGSLSSPQDTGFNFDPEGGSLMSQLATAYGGQTHEEQMGRGPAGFTQGFSDFFTGEGYYADPRGTYSDGPWSISDKPIDLPGKIRGTMQQPNQPFQTFASPGGGKMAGYVPEPYTGGDRGLAMQAGMNLPGAGGRPSDLQQPIQQGVGITGLAAYQQNKGVGI